MTGPAEPALRWVLWAGTTGLFGPVGPRIAAAAGAGYQAVSVGPSEVARLEAAGTSAAALGRRIRDAGLGVVLDPVLNWYDDRSTGSTSEFSRFSASECLRMARELGVMAISTMAHVGPGPGPPVELAAAAFGALCDRADEFGARVQLEFIPMTEIPTLAAAWPVVRQADRANGGLLFDTWHFFRGDPDFGLLAEIPGDKIFFVQLDDAAAEFTGTMLEDTRHRLLPGDGSFDLVRAVRALQEICALRWVGPEVINDELAGLPALDAARLAGDRCREVIGQAMHVPTP